VATLTSAKILPTKIPTAFPAIDIKTIISTKKLALQMKKLYTKDEDL